MSNLVLHRALCTVSLLAGAIVAGPATAEVVVDLSAIGLRTDMDEKIAPGRAPVRLSYPGENEPTRVLLTPPPGAEATQQPAARPQVLEPAGSTPTPAPRTEPAQVETLAARPPVDTPPTPSEPRPAPQPAPEPSPVASAPEPASAEPASAPQPIAPPAPIAAPTVPVEQLAPVATPADNQPAAEETRTAALPPSGDIAYRLRFAPESDTILPETMEELEFVAAELMRHSDRIEIQAYGGEPGDTSSPARRLSLKRGLAIRNFLIGEGVLTSRISVHAFGGVRDTGPRDRVDLKLSRR